MIWVQSPAQFRGLVHCRHGGKHGGRWTRCWRGSWEFSICICGQWAERYTVGLFSGPPVNGTEFFVFFLINILKRRPFAGRWGTCWESHSNLTNPRTMAYHMATSLLCFAPPIHLHVCWLNSCLSILLPESLSLPGSSAFHFRSSCQLFVKASQIQV